MPVDQIGFVVDGIVMCLKGDNLNGAVAIATNEQEYTLQEFMYDKFDLGLLPKPPKGGTISWFPDFLGDVNDIFYLGVAAKGVGNRVLAGIEGVGDVLTAEGLGPKLNAARVIGRKIAAARGGAVLAFAYDPNAPDIPSKYLFPFNTGNVTEKIDRMNYTESVIAAFDTLYANAEDSAYINSEHAQIRSHANAR